MCEFKVGDVVRRIIADNTPSAKIGTIATVVSVDNGRDDVMDVTYGNVASEMWFQDRAELVERKPAPYQFKVAHTFAVGDKGKTRMGSVYTIIAEHNNVFVCHYTSKTGEDLGYTGASRSGMSYDGGSVWLLPPAKTVWRVELTGVKDPKTSGLLNMTSTRYYDTEENARKGIARGVRAYITVKGPFPEEREA